MTKTISGKKSWITEGLILASIPLLAYALTFSYEYGFASVFGIPFRFISFDLTDVFVTFIALAVIFGIIIYLINLFFLLINTKFDNPIHVSLIRFAFSLLFLVIPIYLHKGRLKEWIPFVLLPVLIGWLEFVHPLFAQRTKGNYREKLEAQEALEQNFTSIYDFLGNKGILILTFIFFALFTSFSAGRATAYDERKYLVAHTWPEMVVLRIYGDNLICASFDKKAKNVDKKFRIIKIGDNSNLTLTLEEVGPLHSE